jgi:16S rRNA (guanine527-N7)-methyltransferase
MTIPDFVHRDLEALGFEVPTAMLEQLAGYLDMVLKANETTNLTAIRHREQAWSRLIVDSLTPLPALPADLADGQEYRLIDIGTGAGLPGVPLAIARPDVSVTLVEATGKKIAFLQTVVEGLGLQNVTLANARVETLGQDAAHRGGYDVAVSRAVGPMAVVLEYSLPLLRIGGQVLAMKGPKAEAELRDCGDALTKLGGGEVAVVEAYPESFDNELVLVSVMKETATPKAYPRAVGLPKKQPL